MYLFIVALHVILCIFLVLIIILQPGKGGDVGAAFGGSSSSTMFGPRGPTSLLQRATTAVAVLFMCTSLALAYTSNKSVLHNSNVEDELERLANEQKQEKDGGTETPEAPAPTPAPAAPAPAPVEAPGAPEPAGEGAGE